VSGGEYYAGVFGGLLLFYSSDMGRGVGGEKMNVEWRG